VAGIRDHRKLGVRDELDGFNGVLKANKIVISLNDENRRLDRSQLCLRKSSPLNAANLVINLGSVIWIGCYFLVTLSLKLDAPGLGGRRMIKLRDLSV
jgi:hypothetical protein